MRFWKSLSVFLGALGAILIGVVATLFLVFPRLINRLADVLGTMGEPGGALDPRQAAIHGIIALVIDLILLYFFVWRPLRVLRDSTDSRGLVVRKGEGRAYIDAESVRQQVYNAISKIAGIEHAEVNIGNDEGRAVIQMNIVTDLSLNGPKKKNEINREVRKIVQDQLGVDLSDKPTINFSLVPVGPEVPLIASSAASRTDTTPEPIIRSLPPREIPQPETPPEPEPVAPAAEVKTPTPEPIAEPDNTEILSSGAPTEPPTAAPFERRPWHAPGVVTDVPEPPAESPATGETTTSEPSTSTAESTTTPEPGTDQPASEA